MKHPVKIMSSELDGDRWTLHARIRSTYRVRMWIGVKLICLAAWVLGMGVEVENDVRSR